MQKAQKIYVSFVLFAWYTRSTFGFLHGIPGSIEWEFCIWYGKVTLHKKIERRLAEAFQRRHETGRLKK